MAFSIMQPRHSGEAWWSTPSIWRVEFHPPRRQLLLRLRESARPAPHSTREPIQPETRSILSACKEGEFAGMKDLSTGEPAASEVTRDSTSQVLSDSTNVGVFSYRISKFIAWGLDIFGDCRPILNLVTLCACYVETYQSSGAQDPPLPPHKLR